MSLREKGTIIEIEHKVTRDYPIHKKQYTVALIDIKIHAYADSKFYNEEHHKKMIKELEGVIRKYI
jgi:hypothetical protein